MKLISSSNIRFIDEYTIHNEPITSINLMERASIKLTDSILKKLRANASVFCFAGPGNNGGDALAVARHLQAVGIKVQTFLVASSSHRLSPDCQTNYDRLYQINPTSLHLITTEEELPDLKQADVVIDGLFGSGLNRALEGFFKATIQHINACNAYKIAIDLPSGLFGEENLYNDKDAILIANHTLTLQFPKIAFLMPENEPFVGTWEVLEIGLHPDGIAQHSSPFYFTTMSDCQAMLHARKRFAHKGNFGHALLVAGSFGKIGAALLAGKACLRSGVGLLTVKVPACGYTTLQTALPEAMTLTDNDFSMLSDPIEASSYQAIGVGPGIGTNSETMDMLVSLMGANKPMVIDADGINLLAQHKEFIPLLPQGTILTPHKKELERLIGPSSSFFQSITNAIEWAKTHGVYIILKNAFTAVITPEGSCHFNSTGNPGMATAGSGDVLTGIVLSLLSQGYTPQESAILAPYIHGKAGDLATLSESEESLIASDIIAYLGKAFQETKREKEK